MRKRLWVLPAGILAVVALLGSLGYWWDGWPERSKDRILRLVAAGDATSLNRIMDGSAKWSVHEKGGLTLTTDSAAFTLRAAQWTGIFESPLVEVRDTSDRLAGRAHWVFMAGNQIDMTKPNQFNTFTVSMTVERGRGRLDLTAQLTEMNSTIKVLQSWDLIEVETPLVSDELRTVEVR